jgi:predicted transcriptional regulator
MTTTTKELLESVASWPTEDQQELLEVAREIEARRHHGVYDASPEELAGIDRGLADARAGRFASDEEVNAVKAKFRRV